MVDDLFEALRRAAGRRMFKFVSDVYADQTTEIERMQKMLDAMCERRSKSMRTERHD